jgi:5-methylcytosine-specific restriction protein B
LIEKIKADQLPHILILDEINRTDISRLFGELFSALEYRNKSIRLSIGDLEIALPTNLYFIGTMNEIDFSPVSLPGTRSITGPHMLPAFFLSCCASVV